MSFRGESDFHPYTERKWLSHYIRVHAVNMTWSLMKWPLVTHQILEGFSMGGDLVCHFASEGHLDQMNGTVVWAETVGW